MNLKGTGTLTLNLSSKIPVSWKNSRQSSERHILCRKMASRSNQSKKGIVILSQRKKMPIETFADFEQEGRFGRALRKHTCAYTMRNGLCVSASGVRTSSGHNEGPIASREPFSETS